MRPLAVRELLSIEVHVLPLVDLGGGRRYVPFEGGTFAGRDGLHGTLREGGVDWQSVRADSTLDRVTDLVFQVHSADPPHAHILRSIELTARAVAPALGWEAPKTRRGNCAALVT